LYLFRLFKRTARLEIERQGMEEKVEPVKVFTFFEAGFDTKHASALQFLLEAAEYDVPPRLGEIALADPSRQMCYEQAFGEDPNKKTYGPASKTSKTSKSRDRKDAPEKQNSNSQKSRAKGSRSPVNSYDGNARSGNSSSRAKDDKTSRSWRTGSPDGQWREVETPTHSKPGDFKILKNETKEGKDRGREEFQHPSSTTSAGSTSSAWRPKSHSPTPETMWRPASASTQASSREGERESDLHGNFRKYLNGYRNKSPDSILDDDDYGQEEDLSDAQRQWLMDRSMRCS
jgi:hypothetical protein